MVLGREVGSGTCARSSPLSVFLVARLFLRRAAEFAGSVTSTGCLSPTKPFLLGWMERSVPGCPPQHRRALADGCLPHLAASTGSGGRSQAKAL